MWYLRERAPTVSGLMSRKLLTMLCGDPELPSSKGAAELQRVVEQSRDCSLRRLFWHQNSGESAFSSVVSLSSLITYRYD